MTVAAMMRLDARYIRKEARAGWKVLRDDVDCAIREHPALLAIIVFLVCATSVVVAFGLHL